TRMKQTIYALAILCLALISAQAFAGTAPSPQDRAAMVQLSAMEARKALLELCGVTGDAETTALAKDTEKRATLEASLSDDGKQKLADTIAKIDAGVKTSWDNTPDDLRAKSCAQLKEKTGVGK